MQDAMVNYRTTLAPENLKGLQFIEGTNDYAYLRDYAGENMWVKGDFNSKAELPFISLSQLNNILSLGNLDTFKTIPLLKFGKEDFKVSMKGGTYQYNLNSKTIRLISEVQPKDRVVLEEGKAGYFAYLQNSNLFVGKGKESLQITTDGSPDIVYASSVHQSEFGITKGTFWSTDGSKLAFYRMDQHMIPDYPIIDWSEIPAKNVNIKYPMAGDSSHHVTLGVYDTKTQQTIYLQTGTPAEQFLTNIAWSPNDKFIYIAVVNRQQNHTWLREYDATTGAYLRTLFEETDEKYTEPQVPILFLKNDSKKFIWQSRKDGWNHLYLYDDAGNFLQQLTTGSWEVVSVDGFDDKGNTLFYTATKESPLAKNLYALDLKTYKSRRLTSGDGNHNTIVSDDGSFIIDNYSSPTVPRQIDIVQVSNTKTKTLFIAPDPLLGFALGKMNIYSIKSRDGADLVCRQFYPVNFDSTKKYPLIVYWYGGTHAQMITNSFNGGARDYWFQYLAERGYMVLTVDTRGSAYRGKEWEQAIFRRAGEVQMRDLEDALAYLNTKNYIDKENMGLFGWSYGGFLTTDFLLNHPGTFKAGVAGGPVMNWREYEIMYGERYMDTPQENSEGYKATNLTLQAGKLRDKLLIIHGLQDPVVLQQHSVNFVKACVDAGVQVDYMIYPGHEHNVLGKDRAHLYQKVTDYFDLYLKGKN